MAIEHRGTPIDKRASSDIGDAKIWYRSALFLEILRFGVSGLTSTIFYAATAWLLVTLAEMWPASASVVSYVLSLGVSYGLQSRFTFKEKAVRSPRVARFLCTAFLGLAVSYVLVFVVTEILHWWFVVGNLAVCILIPVANYFVLKFWVFAPAMRPKAGSGSGRHER